MPRQDAATIPIVAMTANAFAEDVKHALEAGMTAHVAKPVDMAVLKGTLEKIQAKNKHSMEAKNEDNSTGSGSVEM